LVGGKIEKGEDKTDALVREITEEIGIEVKRSSLKYIKTHNWIRDDISIIFVIFRSQYVFDNGKIKIDPNEILGYEWVNPYTLLRRDNLMLGLYDILKTVYKAD
jgi:8-oxo-dGTP pyrophosphatase MutT (NUDIX family)